MARSPRYLNGFKAGTRITTPGSGVRIAVRVLLVLCICATVLSPALVLAKSSERPSRPERAARPERPDYRSDRGARINVIYGQLNIPSSGFSIDQPSYPTGAPVFTQIMGETTNTVATSTAVFIPVYTRGVAANTLQSANWSSQPPGVPTSAMSQPAATNPAIAAATIKYARVISETTASPSQTTTIAAEYTSPALPDEETVTDTEFTTADTPVDTATPSAESTPTNSSMQTAKAETPKKLTAAQASPTVQKASLLPSLVGWILMAMIVLTVIVGISARLRKPS